MRILAASALALAVVATPAFAQDKTFEGFHVDGVIGYDHVKDSADKASGVLYGGAVGYDIQTNNEVVIGFEAEGLLSTTKDCVGGACVEAGRDLYGGARLGSVVSDRVMIYLKGGYTNARVEGTNAGTVLVRDDLDGVRVGIGAEFALGNHLAVRTEYRYSNYEQGVIRHHVVLGVGFRF